MILKSQYLLSDILPLDPNAHHNLCNDAGDVPDCFIVSEYSVFFGMHLYTTLLATIF